MENLTTLEKVQKMFERCPGHPALVEARDKLMHACIDCMYVMLRVVSEMEVEDDAL